MAFALETAQRFALVEARVAPRIDTCAADLGAGGILIDLRRPLTLDLIASGQTARAFNFAKLAFAGDAARAGSRVPQTVILRRDVDMVVFSACKVAFGA